MAKQSVSGNRDSASSLGESLAKLNKLTSKYSDSLLEIKETANNLSSKELKGCSNCDEKFVNSSIDSNGNKNDVYHWVATGIKYSTDNLSGVMSTANALAHYIQEFEETYGALNGTDDILENLADYIEKYQNEINKTLSGDTKKKALKGMIGVTFASNKYDAKSKNGIPENKVSTDLENWDGDLKFERQDNGTYLVIKVGKDGSEVPMGYTTKEGKNKYYEEAKNKVLGSSNEKTTSSKENNTSSKENNTSDSNEVASNSIDVGISEDEVSKNLKSTVKNSISLSSWHKLTENEKKSVSKLFIEDLKKQGKTKEDLEGCRYSYWTERIINNGKLQKVVHIDATKRVAKDASSAIKTIRIADGKYTFDE